MVGDSRSISVLTENGALCGKGDISMMSPGAGDEEGNGGVVRASKFRLSVMFTITFILAGYSSMVDAIPLSVLNKFAENRDLRGVTNCGLKESHISKKNNRHS